MIAVKEKSPSLQENIYSNSCDQQQRDLQVHYVPEAGGGEGGTQRGLRHHTPDHAPGHSFSHGHAPGHAPGPGPD